MDSKELNKFIDSLGGRIQYAAPRRNQLTPERDFIIYKTFTEGRARGIDNWILGAAVKERLARENVKYNFAPCYNSIINRFYKIRKAIKDTSEIIKVTT
jgi:hypothetical protein